MKAHALASSLLKVPTGGDKAFCVHFYHAFSHYQSKGKRLNSVEDLETVLNTPISELTDIHLWPDLTKDLKTTLYTPSVLDSGETLEWNPTMTMAELMIHYYNRSSIHG